MATNFSTTESKYIGLFPNAWISLTYRTYRGSVFLLINEEISDKLWESPQTLFNLLSTTDKRHLYHDMVQERMHRIIKLCTFADLRRPINLTDLFCFTNT